MRQLTQNEIRQFYVAYHTLKNEAERFHRDAEGAKELARRYSMVARQIAIQRDLVWVIGVASYVGYLVYYGLL